MVAGIDALRIFLGSWLTRGIATAVLVAAGGAAYWYREQFSSSYTSTEETLLTALSAGIVLIAAWLTAFIYTLAMSRSWFMRANLWFASLILLAFGLGLLAQWDPDLGTMSWFTLDGDVVLGGEVGTAIAGSGAGIGGLFVWLRLSALGLVGLGIAAPSLAGSVGVGLWKILTLGYFSAAVGAKSGASGLKRMYKVSPNERFTEAEADSKRERTRVLTEAVQPRALPAAPIPPDYIEQEALTPLPRPVAEVQAPSEDIPPPMAPPEFISAPEAANDAQETSLTAEPAAEAGKYNRYWGASGDVISPAPTPSVQRFENADKTDQDANVPITDNMAASWKLPPRDLLKNAPLGGISKQEMADTGETIKRTLGEYGVEVEIGQIQPGPTVTMYGLIPGWVRRYKQVKVTDDAGKPKLNEQGKPVTAKAETKTRVKVDSIMSREKDLGLALKTPSIRIETPVMGEALVGIEVPNPNPSLVTLRGVVESEQFQSMRDKAKLPIALGKGSGGEDVVIDLAKMPHLLVAGATGSGKSVCINTIVSGLISERTPSELRLLLIDPKRVELTPYNGIPHLLTPVVVESDQVVGLLKGLIQEMLNRYRRMEEEGVRNIDSFNRKMSDKMPYLVVAVDELADLMMTSSFEVEQTLCRLAQLGRATGIHLIVATQRPSVDVVTGLIKANFPSRISFGVTSQIDSRTILDTSGAEKLLGRGDMLYQAVDASRPERVQGVFISDGEIEDLVEYWKDTKWPPLPEVSLHSVGDGDSDDTAVYAGNAGGGLEAKDVMLDKATELARHNNKLSTSLLQRRLRIGYPRAARLMDQLEEEGVIGPADGSKSRDVIIGTA
jgi:S-DNA-T family DNA segregation ATPase FtsK/SpoIIIE